MMADLILKIEMSGNLNMKNGKNLILFGRIF